MSELIENRKRKREILKHMILQLHQGEAPEAVRAQLARLLGEVPYDDVVAVEQELIADGIPHEEILKLCDLHAAVLEGRITGAAAKRVPPGHPVDVMLEENRMLRGEIDLLRKSVATLDEASDPAARKALLGQFVSRLRNLLDVEKHYARKENLLFPFLEKKGVTGPPKVMWGKDDEVREKVKAALEAMKELGPEDPEEIRAVLDLAILPAAKAIEEMIGREEEILFPMSLDLLDDKEWFEIHRQTPEIGFCLYDPPVEWWPAGIAAEETAATATVERIALPSGTMTPEELTAIFNTIPFDMTFVDRDDTVRYFTQGRERIFNRNRAILGRKVQFCHPPSSVGTVQKILDDFHAGREKSAAFWITLNGRFIHIEYFALRNAAGEYLGTLEVSQDLTEKRALTGERRLLEYDK
jgi:hypothetical protein